MIRVERIVSMRARWEVEVSEDVMWVRMSGRSWRAAGKMITII